MRAQRDRAIGASRWAYRSPHPWLGPTLAGDRRWVGRAACRTAAAFREREQTRFEVEIVNLSTRGCAVRSDAAPPAGALGWIVLPTLESWYARVAWRDGDLFGLDFSAPLHRAVAAMVVERANRKAAAPAIPA